MKDKIPTDLEKLTISLNSFTQNHWYVTYWTSGEEGEGHFETIECLIFDDELKNLLNKDTRFIKAIVDEGQIAILAVENINYMEQIPKERLANR